MIISLYSNKEISMSGINYQTLRNCARAFTVPPVPGYADRTRWRRSPRAASTVTPSR